MLPTCRFHRIHSLLVITLLVFAVTLVLGPAWAQKDRNLFDAYSNHTDAAREVIYVHLNKSTYIKGESIGFTAYVMDKKNKMPSLLTTNLYISVESMEQQPIKQQLLKVENGVASNVIDIDNDFATGSYIFKAYTNWSRNFNEPNYFASTIKVIDPTTDAFVDTERVEAAIDAQFLPESGHLLADIVNKVGVVVKDPKGYGLSNASGKVLDANGELLTSFKVNHLGIGQFLLKPSIGDALKVVITHNYKDFEFSLNQPIQPIGLVLNTAQRNNQLLLNIITNDKSMASFKNKSFKLVFHNGADIQIESLVFSKSTSINKTFDLNQLPPGVTVFTVFNANNKPIAERLFFNYKGIDIHKPVSVKTAMVENDSIDIALTFNSIDPRKFHNISVSVLPADTKSYKHHHNLISYNYLQPYIKGHIEQAKYYFNDISQKTMADLDMLLLTQGWSAYDWNHIFNSSNNLPFDFERGISFKANVNRTTNQEISTYMVSAFEDEPPLFFELEQNQRSFSLDHLFTNEHQSIDIARSDNKDNLKPVDLYLQFFPSEIPKFKVAQQLFQPKPDYDLNTGYENNYMTTPLLDQLQRLDEVVVNAEVDALQSRIDSLQRRSEGTVIIPTEKQTEQYPYLEDYIKFELGPTKITRINGKRIVSPYQWEAVLLRIRGYFRLTQIDYMVRNADGLQIWMDYSEENQRRYNETLKSYKPPLHFTSEKRYYTPIYGNQTDSFFKNFGVLSWFPRLQLNNYNKTQFKIERPKVPIALFIEGIDHLGNPVLTEQILTIN